MSTTIIAMKIRVKEVSPPDVEKTRDLFRDFLERTMALHSTLTMEGLKTLPKCVGITKIDRLTLYSGLAVKKVAPDTRESLQTDLRMAINAFLEDTTLSLGEASKVFIEFYDMPNTESAFVEGVDKATAALRSGRKTSSEIAKATGLDDQLNNVLLCLLEEECLARREETNELDDIFHPVESGNLQKTDDAIRKVLKTGPLSRDSVFKAVKTATGIEVRREWVRKILKDLVASGVVSQDSNGNYTLVI